MSNEPMSQQPTRRDFLTGSLAALAGGLNAGEESVRNRKRVRVAAVFTVLRFRSHAYNILENFFKPYYFGGKPIDPGCDVVAFYADQFPDGDMTRDVSKRFKVPLFKSIRDAVSLGGKESAVDAVLSIGEHGEYPFNTLGQHLYPRKRFFDEITKPMLAAGKSAPIFNDKHLSWSWTEAKQMYDVCRKHGIPLAAGSSVPLAQRIPMVEIPDGTEYAEAVSIHGGGFESYDFHALEVLQSFVESRKGGETGVSEVELLHGDALMKAIRSGRISQPLIDAAMAAEKSAAKKRQRFPGRGKSGRPAKPRKPIPNLKRPKGPHAIVLTYKDGFRAATLVVPGGADRWNFACRLKGETKPRATMLFNGPWGNRCLFKALSHSIQHLFKTRKEPYPVERTLLATGILDAAVRSFATGRSIRTPHLEFAYRPIDFRAMRENGESWKRITVETKQPVEFSPGDARLTRGTN
jgi:hypothetical protein